MRWPVATALTPSWWRRIACQLGVHRVDVSYAPWPWQERCHYCGR